jgi:methylenetetrahydrofolate dehydrogenase (NADP+)/methenyltetrahydrofolate cyclohydrolase
MTKVINGNEIAQEIIDSIKAQVTKIDSRPKLVIISYNADVHSKVYIDLKLKKANEVSIKCEVLDWSGKSLDECKAEMQNLANDVSVNAIIAQLPMHKLDGYQEVLDLIPASKDVDGLSSSSMEMLKESTANLVPATPKAILEVIKQENIELNNKNVLIIGQGKLVGLPLSIILKNQGFKVMTADKNTQNMTKLTLDADIIITATGSPHLINGGMIKQGAVVLDAGAAEADGKIVGDVDYNSVEPKASVISKVPGGIGPVTVACLLENVLETSKTHNNL